MNRINRIERSLRHHVPLLDYPCFGVSLPAAGSAPLGSSDESKIAGLKQAGAFSVPPKKAA